MINASGIGTYLRGCLPYLLKSKNYFLLLGDAAQLYSFSSFSSANAEIIECKIKPFSLRELFFFPQIMKERINKADFYFSPYCNIPGGIKIPVFTTIHDIIFPDMPELVSKVGLAARMWFYRRAYKKSEKIFTVSEFSKSRIQRHLGEAKPVIVTYVSIQNDFFGYQSIAKNIKKEQTLVFLGNIKKHKGLDLLLEAFLEAKKEGLPHKLLIIGSKEKLRSADHLILQKIDSAGSDVISITSFISDERLMEYLASAALLVMPSLYEGFGIPPLEAMVLGTHVLISDIPSLSEIYADYPVTFFRAGDADDLKEKIITLLKNKQIASPVLSDELLSKYTFEKTASVILHNLSPH
jgi:glycosyltransferase involved in cell wall biosynthesis